MWDSHCEHVYLLAMATCSYLCKKQRIRRQGSSGPSYYSSRSDIAMHSDHVAVRMNSTRDGAFEQSVTTCWEAGANWASGCLALSLRAPRCGKIVKQSRHSPTQKKPAPNLPLLTNCTYRQQHVSFFPQLIAHACFLRRATEWETEGRKTTQKLTHHCSEGWETL